MRRLYGMPAASAPWRDRSSGDAPPPHPRVRVDSATASAREMEAWRLIAAGYSDKQIAHALGVAYDTAHAYVRQLRRKLDAPNKAALARMYAEQHPCE